MANFTIYLLNHYKRVDFSPLFGFKARNIFSCRCSKLCFCYKFQNIKFQCLISISFYLIRFKSICFLFPNKNKITIRLISKKCNWHSSQNFTILFKIFFKTYAIKKRKSFIDSLIIHNYRCNVVVVIFFLI